MYVYHNSATKIVVFVPLNANLYRGYLGGHVYCPWTGLDCTGIMDQAGICP